MAHRTSSSNSAPPMYKHKWKATHVIKVNLGDDESDGEGFSTAVVQQASCNGQQFVRQLHSVPLPHDPQTPAAPYNPPSAEGMDFMMSIMDEADEEEPDAPISPQVCSLISVPFV